MSSKVGSAGRRCPQQPPLRQPPALAHKPNTNPSQSSALDVVSEPHLVTSQQYVVAVVVLLAVLPPTASQRRQKAEEWKRPPPVKPLPFMPPTLPAHLPSTSPKRSYAAATGSTPCPSPPPPPHITTPPSTPGSPTGRRLQSQLISPACAPLAISIVTPMPPCRDVLKPARRIRPAESRHKSIGRRSRVSGLLRR